jgi:hypothetical protein
MISFSEKRFQRLCKSLRRNDPKVTDISTWGDSLERHSCHTLGKALLNNTVVTIIKIELDYVLCEYDDDVNLDEFEPLITFLRNSPSLTALTLKRRHCALDPIDLSNTLAERILQAIVANPHCKVKLNFDVAECHFELASALKVARSIVSLRIELDHFRKGTQPRLMADALWANQSLESLELYTLFHFDVATPMLLQLRSSLRYLRVHADVRSNLADRPFRALIAFLEATETLEHLSLSYFELTREHWDLFVEPCNTSPKYQSYP